VTLHRPECHNRRQNIVHILVCVATPFEADRLKDRSHAAGALRIIVTGVGPVNAAHAVTVEILKQRPNAIIGCGIAGAYPSSGLQIGDVVSAEVEIYGDLGAQSPTGFVDMKTMGFPVVAGSVPLFNELPMQVFPSAKRARFVTVSTCTGTETVAREVEARTSGAVENMEGAAIAHIAHLHGIPVGEIRGISNAVTNRDSKSWRIKEASAAAQEALLRWIDQQ